MNISIAQNFALGKDVCFDETKSCFTLAPQQAGVAQAAKRVFDPTCEKEIEDNFLTELDQAYTNPSSRRWLNFSERLIHRLETIANPHAALTIFKIKQAQQKFLDENFEIPIVCPDFLALNRSFILGSIIANPETIKYIPDNIYRDDQELFFTALKGLNLESNPIEPFAKLNPEKLKDREFAKKACAVNGLSLKFLPEFQNDPEISMIAVKQNAMAIFHTSRDFKWIDENIIQAAIFNPAIMGFEGWNLRVDLIKEIAKYNAHVLEVASIHHEILKDPNVITNAFRQNPVFTETCLLAKGVDPSLIQSIKKTELDSFEQTGLVDTIQAYPNQSVREELFTSLFQAQDLGFSHFIPSINSNADIPKALASTLIVSMMQESARITPSAGAATGGAAARDAITLKANLEKHLKLITSYKKDFKDSAKLKVLLDFLVNLKHLPISNDQKLALIDKFSNPETDPKNVLQEALNLMALLPFLYEQVGIDKLLEITPFNHAHVLHAMSQTLVDQGLLKEELREKFAETFIKSRAPSAIFTYSAHFISNAVMKPAIEEFISLVCNKSLDDWRMIANSHRSYLKGDQQSKWNLSLEPQEFETASFQNIEFSPKEFLTNKIIPLSTKAPAIDLTGLEAILSTSNAPPAGSNELIKKLHAFCYATYETREEALKEVLTYLRSNHRDSPLIAAFEGLQKTKKGVVIDSEDWQDLFLCGTEVIGSCQNVAGSPNTNKCLLGYVLDGKTRILCVKETPDGPIKARALLKIFVKKETIGSSSGSTASGGAATGGASTTGEEKEVPCLFIEKSYGAINPHIKNQLIGFAKKKAASLGVELYKAGDGVELYSKGVHAPFEYEDGALAGPDGHITHGIYNITGTFIP